MPRKSSADLKAELEQPIEDYLCTQAEKHGGLALKLRPPVGRGFPDRTLFLPGPWVALVEVKRPSGGVVAKQQEIWAGRLGRAGQNTFLASNREEIDAIFATYRRQINDPNTEERRPAHARTAHALRVEHRGDRE